MRHYVVRRGAKEMTWKMRFYGFLTAAAILAAMALAGGAVWWE
jgi:hypothetical protein